MDLRRRMGNDRPERSDRLGRPGGADRRRRSSGQANQRASKGRVVRPRWAHSKRGTVRGRRTPRGQGGTGYRGQDRRVARGVRASVS